MTSSPRAHSAQMHSLKDSTIARLLVSGTLPTDQSSSESDKAVMDLSNKQVNQTQSPRNYEQQQESDEVYQEMRQEMERLIQVPRKLRSGAIMKCRYCPYGASDARTLYSHYQFHQQVIASSSPASRSHLDWMTAYRREKGGAISMPCIASDKTGLELDAAKWFEDKRVNDAGVLLSTVRPKTTGKATLLKRALLDDHAHAENSASGCLRSIVQTIMQNGPNPTASSAIRDSLTDSDVAQQRNAYRTAACIIPKVGIATTLCGEQTDAIPSERMLGSVFIKTEPGGADESSGSHSECVTPSTADDYESQTPSQTKRTRSADDRFEEYLSGSDNNHMDRLCGSEVIAPVTVKSENKRAICRLMPRVMGNPTPMLRAMLGKKRRRTTSNYSDTSQDGTGADFSKSVTVSDATTQCALAFTYAYPNDIRGEPRPSETVAVQCAEAEDNEIAEESSSAMRCTHCGITFEDDVLHSLHMGCHSHRDPFICNVCGRHCMDRYGFYTHIMRGHQN